MHTRAQRRHDTYRHLNRRLKEDRNQHYDDLTCPCWSNGKAIARFKEQPQLCSGPCCGNPRRWWNELTRQEKRHLEAAAVD